VAIIGSATTIPNVDVGGIDASRSEFERISGEIGAAARGIGFFSVVNHGIAPDLIESVFAQAAIFFHRPQAEKDALSVANSRDFRGYVKIGEERLDPAYPPDIKECFNVGRDLAPDDAGILAGIPFHAVNQWPSLPEFRETLVAFYREMRALELRLTRAVAFDLGIAEDYFAPMFDPALVLMRLLRYPPHPGTFDGSAFGAGAHTDYGFLTLLAQDDVGGLEVRARDGSWIDVPPVANAFVCNIGDCLMRWTNDLYVSNSHRVVNRTGRERYSIAVFGDPNPDALVECLPSCLAPGEAPKYPPVTYADYLRSRYDETYTVAPKPA
jgi:isopenicillin N synthase-like dioxygenase